MDRISNRTGINFESRHENTLKTKDGGDEGNIVYKIKKRDKEFNFTCKAREYGPKMGRILQAFGFAVKIGDKYYNTKSLAKRMVQSILHCPVEKSSRKDKQDIQSTSEIWKKTLADIGDKKTLNPEELAELYEGTLDKVKEKFDSLGTKYKLLFVVDGEDESVLISLFKTFDPKEKGAESLTDTLQKFGPLNFKQVLKEEWFKQECCKKDGDNFVIASLFDNIGNIKREEDVDLMIDILEMIGDTALIQKAKENLVDKENWSEFASYAHRKINPLLGKHRINPIPL